MQTIKEAQIDSMGTSYTPYFVESIDDKTFHRNQREREKERETFSTKFLVEKHLRWPTFLIQTATLDTPRLHLLTRRNAGTKHSRKKQIQKEKNCNDK